MSTRQSAAPSTGWMLLRSSWMLLTAVPGGVLGWLGFLIIGFTGRLRRWVITGFVLGALSLLAALPIWGQWRGVVGVVVYVAGMLLALAANPSWLQAQWERSQPSGSSAEARSTASHRSSSPRRSAPKKSGSQRSRSAAPSAPRQTTAPAASAQVADGQAQRLAQKAGATSEEFFAPSEAAEPIDVNAADARELAKLPGLTRARARDLVKQRDRQGGFASLDAFATAARVQPHELVRLRQQAVCSPPARGPRQFGRRVDY